MAATVYEVTTAFPVIENVTRCQSEVISLDGSKGAETPAGDAVKKSTRGSILRNNSITLDRPRKDSYGMLIAPAKKNHRIRIKEDAKQVNVVENWKEYNIMSEERTCLCNTF